MSETIENEVTAQPASWPDRRSGIPDVSRTLAAPDARRWLQLGLAAIWLLDAVLQLQSFMFTKAFGQTLGSGPGNSALIADPITWSTHIIEAHPAWTNAVFATVQLFLALGLAWRPAVKVTLAASMAWSAGVWWFGEGLGGVFNGTANPVTGAPGAVIIYALIAVLVWPTNRDGPFEAARPLGSLTARLLWLTLWGSFAYFALLAVNRTSQGLHDMIAGMAAGEPGWLASLDRNAATLVAGRGALASVVLAVVFGIIAIGIFLPAHAVRAVVLLAVAVALIIWVVGENFGGVLAGSATDPNTGPLLVLLAVAYWPAVSRRQTESSGDLAPLAGIAK
jgi:hypothetical protein